MKVLIVLAVFIGLGYAQTHPPIGCSQPVTCLTGGETIGDRPAADEAECRRQCHHDNRCWYYTFIGGDTCIHFLSCPTPGACGNCLSGDRDCHDGILCNRPGECSGVAVGGTVDVTAEECVQGCNDNDACQWFSYNYADQFCEWLSSCDHQINCPSCVFGESGCEPSEVTPPAHRTTTASP